MAPLKQAKLKRRERKEAAKLKLGNKGYFVCPVERRVELLLELVSRHYDRWQKCWTKKIAIVFCHSNCVKFFTDLFSWFKGCPVLGLLKRDVHTADGREKLAQFTAGATGCIATMANAVDDWQALGLDAIVQYDPPASVSEVVTLSIACPSWYSVFLRPQELGFVKHFRTEGGRGGLQMREVHWAHINRLPATRMQQQYKSEHFANITSKGTYKAYLDCLENHDLKQHFNLDGILYKEVSDAFGLEVPPRFVPKPVSPEVVKAQPLPKKKRQTAFKKHLDRVVKERDLEAVGKIMAVIKRKEQDAEKKIRERKTAKLLKRGLVFPDMKIKNLSRNLKRKDAVYSEKGTVQLRDKLNLPKWVTSITLKDGPLDSNPNFEPRARRD